MSASKANQRTGFSHQKFEQGEITTAGELAYRRTAGLPMVRSLIMADETATAIANAVRLASIAAVYGE